MKKALVISLMVLVGLLFASSVMTAWAGPTVGITYLDYDEDVAGSEWLLTLGFSYVHEFGSSLGALGNFKLTDLVIHSDPWEFAIAGYIDVQGTYDFTLYAVKDMPIFVLRPGVGFILPLELAMLTDAPFAFAIHDPAVVGSMSLVVPYLTLRGEVFYSAKGFGWAAGASIDWFDWAPLFRTNKDTTEASK